MAQVPSGGGQPGGGWAGPYYGGYQPPAPYLPPVRNSSSPAMWARLGTLLTWVAGFIIFAPLVLFCWVVPLIIRTKYPHDPFVRHHATQALNSTLTGLALIVALLVVAITAFLGAGGVVLTVLAALVALGLGLTRGIYEILGSVKASNGELFPLPPWLAFPFLKDNMAEAPQFPGALGH